VGSSNGIELLAGLFGGSFDLGDGSLEATGDGSMRVGGDHDQRRKSKGKLDLKGTRKRKKHNSDCSPL